MRKGIIGSRFLTAFTIFKENLYNSHLFSGQFRPFAAFLVMFALAAISILRIVQTPSNMYWDQSYLNYSFQDPYPIPEQGFPQFWLAGIIQLTGKLSSISLNTALRMIS